MADVSDVAVEHVPLLSRTDALAADPTSPAPVSFLRLATPGISLAVATVGAGILSFPFATAGMGIVLCGLFTTLFAVLNLVTDCVLVAFAREYSTGELARTQAAANALLIGDNGPVAPKVLSQAITFEQLLKFVIPR